MPTTLIAELQAIASIALSSSHTTELYSADGFGDIVIGLTSSQSGAINLLRYVDDAGTVLLDTVGGTNTPPTVALTATDASTLIANDGKPFASFKVQITNTSGSTAATLSNIAVLMSAH